PIFEIFLMLFDSFALFLGHDNTLFPAYALHSYHYLLLLKTIQMLYHNFYKYVVPSNTYTLLLPSILKYPMMLPPIINRTLFLNSVQYLFHHDTLFPINVQIYNIYFLTLMHI